MIMNILLMTMIMATKNNEEYDVTKSGSFGVICEKLPSTVLTGLVLSTSYKNI